MLSKNQIEVILLVAQNQTKVYQEIKYKHIHLIDWLFRIVFKKEWNVIKNDSWFIND